MVEWLIRFSQLIRMIVGKNGAKLKTVKEKIRITGYGLGVKLTAQGKAGCLKHLGILTPYPAPSF